MRQITETMLVPGDICRAMVENMIPRIESLLGDCLENYQVKTNTYILSVPSQLLRDAAQFTEMFNRETNWDENGRVVYIELNTEYGEEEWAIYKVAGLLDQETVKASVVSNG